MSPTGATIAVDTSALVAIFLAEGGPIDFGRHLHESFCLIGTPTLVELDLVLRSRIGHDGCENSVHYLQSQPNIRFVPFDMEHYRLAATAFARFGKGRHPAALNFGDCLTYAVAKAANVPLLFQGNDFSRTDLVSAIPDTV